MTAIVAAEKTAMSREIRESPEVVGRQLAANRSECETLARRFGARSPRLIATCARGSSDHAATYGKYLIETTLGIPVSSSAPSVGTVYRTRMDLADTLFVVISQSGQSPDLVANTEWARACGALVVALVNDTNSPVAAASDVVLPLHAGPERSVAATKTCIASLSALAQLVAHLGARADLLGALDRLPDQLRQALALDWSPAVVPFAAAEDLLVIGRGLSLGIAQEAALKFKETAAIHAEGFSGAELMHGPLALVREGYPLLVFSQGDETRGGIRALVADLRAKGARVFVAEEGPEVPFRLPVVPGVHPALASVSMVQSFYRLALGVATARGFDPDRPPHLSKVTETR